ncbi:MAG: patatin-like phospholipase family protein [Calditrichaeota bacterium]|nr:patatin-like phospholipase family protein [Calditrichota bacterium]
MKVDFKKWFLGSILLLLFFSRSSDAQLQRTAPEKQTYSLALVLSGGAALGYAHLGVLKVLEENGVQPDLIVGTSMGAIIGGHVAAGVPLPALIRQASSITIFKLMDWSFLGLGFFSWEKTEKLFRANLDHKTFAELKIPFAAVATDLYTGEKVVLDSGDVVTAMLASASVPGIYTPVKIDGHTLVDGGLVENLPVPTAKALGARYVIAVDVHHPLLKENIRTPFDVIRQAIYISQDAQTRDKMSGADVLIRPDLQGLSYTKFSAVDKGIEVGARAAREKLPEIEALLRKIQSGTSDEKGKE